MCGWEFHTLPKTTDGDDGFGVRDGIAIRVVTFVEEHRQELFTSQSKRGASISI
jgi:hypothetical protein